MMNSIFRFSHGSGPFSYGMGAILEFLLLTGIVAGAIALQTTFLSAKNEGRFTGFTGWLYNFLTFRIGILRGLLQFLYIFLVLGQIIVSLTTILFGQGLVGFVFLVVGQIVLRLVYEVVLLFVNLCYSVMDINRKLESKQVQLPPGVDARSNSDAPPKPEF